MLVTAVMREALIDVCWLLCLCVLCSWCLLSVVFMCVDVAGVCKYASLLFLLCVGCVGPVC